MFVSKTSVARAVRTALCLSVMGASMVGHAATNLVQNGSFELPGAPFPNAQDGGSYCYTHASLQPGWACGTVPAWTGDFELIAASSGPWGTPSSLANASLIDGRVVGGLQNISSLNQDITLTGGSYTLSWADANRTNYGGNQQYEVLLGSTSLGVFGTQMGQGWAAHSVTLNAGAGQQTLSFRGLTNTADQTSFIDNVQLTAVPEPGSMALVLAGLAVVAGVARRRIR
jgi:hypothetical protein